MIEAIAIVTRTGSGRVWIRSQQSGACGGCLQQSSCGTTALAGLLPSREFAVECAMKLHAGDRVRVAIDDSHLLFGSALLYLLPLLLMIAGVGLAMFFLPPPAAEAWLPEIALSGLLLAFAMIHRLQHRLWLHFGTQPKVLGRL
ncbi:MAG: SoxR reducing system RseC family protein [Gammaproteobacteria bacterium]